MAAANNAQHALRLRQREMRREGYALLWALGKTGNMVRPHGEGPSSCCLELYTTSLHEPGHKALLSGEEHFSMRLHSEKNNVSLAGQHTGVHSVSQGRHGTRLCRHDWRSGLEQTCTEGVGTASPDTEAYLCCKRFQ